MRKDGMLPVGIDNHGYTPTLGKGIKQGIVKWTREKEAELHNALTGLSPVNGTNSDTTSISSSSYRG